MHAVYDTVGAGQNAWEREREDKRVSFLLFFVVDGEWQLFERSQKYIGLRAQAAAPRSSQRLPRCTLHAPRALRTTTPGRPAARPPPPSRFCGGYTHCFETETDMS